MKKIDGPKRSDMHKFVRDVLRKTYPGFVIEEEKPVECGRRRTLPCDLCIPSLKVVIECHGRQHFEHVPHFHATKEDFTAQQSRDMQKAQAIRDAGWAYVMIRYDEYEKLNPKKIAKLITKALKEN